MQETTEKISQIKDRLKDARDHQKSYVDKRIKPLEFSVGDHVLLKVLPWKEEIQVDAKLNFVEEPVEILERKIKKLKQSRIPIVKVLDTGCGSHICNNTQGFKVSKSMVKGELNLRVCDGSFVGVEAVGTYKLNLPSGIVLQLHNWCYVPWLIKNVMSYNLLSDNGFDFKSSSKTIYAFKNDLFYFKVVSHQGLYILNLQAPNGAIFHVSARQPRYGLNKAYLWHCRLGHISEKRI
ncbi:hypothetical protein Tco_1259367 [Tanacetum coccineum]